MNGHDDYRRSDDSGDGIRWLAAGFGMGLLIGGALGLLLAPKSGRETREQIKTVATDLSSRARSMATDLGDRAKTTYNDVTDRTMSTVGDVTQKVKDKAGNLIDKATTMKDAATHAVEAAKEGYKKKMDELS
jgi:gas vesicle protein